MLCDRRVLIPKQRESRLEVHVDHEPGARDEPQRAQQRHDAPVLPPREFESENSQRDEHQRDHDHGHGRQRAPPLPGTVLEEVDELLADNLESPGLARHHRIVQQAAAPELLAPDDGEERPPMFGVGLVEQRMEAGADVEERVDRNPDGRDADRQNREGARTRQRAGHDRAEEHRPTENEQEQVAEPTTNQHDPQRAERRPLGPFRPPLVPIERGRRAERKRDEERDGGSDEQRQQVIADRQGRDVDDEQQNVRRARGAPHVAPSHAQPADRGDAECRDGIDLGLVAVLPSGERERRQDRSRGRAARPEPWHLAREQPVRDEKQAPGAGRGETGAHQIQPPRVAAESDHAAPDVSQQHEQRRPGRMRNAEHLGGGDELPGIPQGDRGREGDHISDEDQERDRGRLPVGGFRWQAESRARRPRDATRRRRADRVPVVA